MIKVGDKYFEMIEQYRDCFDEEQFANRYSEILDKYDFVVGDFGYEQLRLKGFYKDSNKKVEISKRFATIQDYLLEYCNFGCAYFILRRIPERELKKLRTQEEIEANASDKLHDVKIAPSLPSDQKQKDS